MAKYCGNCGSQMDDSAKVCGNCGTPFDSVIKFADPEKQKATEEKVKRTVSICAVAVALILVVVIALKVITSFTGYNGLVRKVMNAYEKYDIDTLVSLSSDVYYYANEDWVEYYFKYSVGDNLDELESSVGHNYKLSYEVDEIYTVSERKLKGMLEQIEYEYYGFDTDIIDKIAIADLTVTATKGSKSKSKDVNIVMSKEDGDWKLLYIE